MSCKIVFGAHGWGECVNAEPVTIVSETQPMLFEACTKTVSLLYSILFGAGDACIDMSAVSIFSALAVFILLVVAAQIVARRVWARLMHKPAGNARDVTQAPERRLGQVAGDDDPIKSGRV